MQLRASTPAFEEAVAASGTSLTDIFGIGPIVAAMIIGHTRDIHRFASRDRFAAYCRTAPIEFESGGRSIHRLSLRGNRQLNHAIHIIAVTQIRHRHSPGRGSTTASSPKARPRKKRYARSNDGSATSCSPSYAPTRPNAVREGKRGRLQSSAAGLTPRTPALRKNHSRTPPTLDAPTAPPRRRHRVHEHLLTTKRRSLGSQWIGRSAWADDDLASQGPRRASGLCGS